MTDWNHKRMQEKLERAEKQRDRLLEMLIFVRKNGIFASFIPQRIDAIIAEIEDRK